MPRLVIEKSEGWTECECPESLCQHLPDRMRHYPCWIVWDTVRNDHAYLTVEDFNFQHEYERRGDAVRDLRRYNEQLVPL